ncbi:MAG: hypothetical protein JO073_00870 [Actinobacteria bacterium]|nr:hypothetical protein [Actinomycetota bacterium]
MAHLRVLAGELLEARGIALDPEPDAGGRGGGQRERGDCGGQQPQS